MVTLVQATLNSVHCWLESGRSPVLASQWESSGYVESGGGEDTLVLVRLAVFLDSWLHRVFYKQVLELDKVQEIFGTEVGTCFFLTDNRESCCFHLEEEVD